MIIVILWIWSLTLFHTHSNHEPSDVSCLLRNLSSYLSTGKSFFLQVKLLFGLITSITNAVNLVILENHLYYSDFYQLNRMVYLLLSTQHIQLCARLCVCVCVCVCVLSCVQLFTTP